MSAATSKSMVVIVLILCLAGTVAGRGKVDPGGRTGYNETASNEVTRTDIATITDPLIQWPTYYGVQRTGTLNTTFNCFGQFGRGFAAAAWVNTVPQWPRASFETPPASQKEYLFGGGFWIGAVVDNDTMVSTGADGWSREGHEFKPPDFPAGSVEKFNYPTDYSMRAVFTDTCEYTDPSWYQPHIPINIRISERSHVWRNPADEDIVIYDFVITNIGDQLLEEVYVGQFIDCDVGIRDQYNRYFVDDLTGSIREYGLAYTIDNDGDPDDYRYDPTTSVRKILALKLLASSHEIADTNFNWWVNNGLVIKDFGPRLLPTPDDPYFDFGTGGLGTPEGDTNKYYLLSHREWDYDQVYTGTIGPDDPTWMTPPAEIADLYSLGTDSKFLLSWGPFDIDPNESVRMLVGMFTADNVHEFPLASYLFLPNRPADFVASLNFDDLLANSSRADELAAVLLDPFMPPMGLEVTDQDPERAVIGWDPWVFDNIDGHEIFLAEVPAEEIPYPGVVPPWVLLESPRLAASIGTENSFVFEDIRKSAVYLAAVAHRAAGEVGQTCDPVVIDYRNQTPPDVASQTAVFSSTCSPDEPLSTLAYPTISWSPPKAMGVDRYNIYRFDTAEDLANRYYPFYDEGQYKDIIVPTDTIVIDDKTYYLYAMDVYAELEGRAHEFTDTDPVDGAFYIVTAVDRDGCESRFSEIVTSYEVNCFDKDVLVFTNLGGGWAAKDSIQIFYQDILGGYQFDIYDFPDTVSKYDCSDAPEECVRWEDFTSYKLLIIEEDSYHPVLTETFEAKSHNVANYLSCGGRLAYFGGFEGFNEYDRYRAGYYPADHEFISQFFGIDSIFYYGFCYYGVWPYGQKLDTSFGFVEARSVLLPWPDVYYDQARNPYSTLINYAWGSATPPSVATFAVNDRGEISHAYHSLYPETSLIDGAPVGVVTNSSGARTFLYGFHLWYMERPSARSLIDALFRGIPGGSDGKDAASVPDELILGQNYPNPFNPSTEVKFSLSEAATVTLEIFNVLGQRVNTLIDGRVLQPGAHTVEWRGDDSGGQKVSSGIYFCRLEAGTKTATKKMMLLK